MTQPRAVVNIVAAKAGTHQFLEQIRLFVAAFGRAKTSQRFLAIGVAQTNQLARCVGQSLFPRRFTEHFAPVCWVSNNKFVFNHAFFANQRHSQTLVVVRIVKTKAAFDAQPVVVRRAIAAIHTHNCVVFDVVGQQATDAAERADRIDFFINNL